MICVLSDYIITSGTTKRFALLTEKEIIRNIKPNPDVTVLIDVIGSPLRGVLIYGRAELDYEDVIEKRIRIFEKYMSTRPARDLALGLASKFKPVIIRIKPERISSYDYAKDDLIQIG